MAERTRCNVSGKTFAKEAPFVGMCRREERKGGVGKSACLAQQACCGANGSCSVVLTDQPDNEQLQRNRWATAVFTFLA